MVKKGKAPARVHTTKPTAGKTGGIDNNMIMLAGGGIALAGLAFGAYFWMSSLQASQQQQQQINSAAKPPQATANAQAIGGGGIGFPAIIPGTALITAGAVNPLGAFHTLFPIFGGAQVFTLTRRSCDPVVGGVPTQADLASQGVVITSYQVNNIGLPGPPGVCGIPRMSITVGTTDPSSAIKLQALGFVPGTYGGGLLGGFGGFVPPWSRPMLPTVYPPFGIGPVPPIGGFPGNVPPIFPGVIPPYPSPRPMPPVFPLPLPVPKAPWWYPYRFPAKAKRKHRHKRKKGHEPVHIIGIAKHNFIRPVGHVLNFDRH